MEGHAYFWSHFEEPAVSETTNQNIHGKTQTRQREEPDQRRTGITAGTNTMTATREEPDQDSHHLGYEAIPRSAYSTSMKTLTEAREEPDQDVSCQSYRAFKCKS
jgi:hypothetical protein